MSSQILPLVSFDNSSAYIYISIYIWRFGNLYMYTQNKDNERRVENIQIFKVANVS